VRPSGLPGVTRGGEDHDNGATSGLSGWPNRRCHPRSGAGPAGRGR